MTHSSADSFVQELFAYMAGAGIKCVLLHGNGSLSCDKGGDIDFAVPVADFDRLPDLIAQFSEKAGWKLIKILAHESQARTAFVVHVANPFDVVQLDWCGDFTRNGRLFLTNSEIIKSAIRKGSFWTPSPAISFAYILSKRLQKKNLTSGHISQLRILENMDPAGCKAEIQRLLGKRWYSLDNVLKQMDGNPNALYQALARSCAFSMGRRMSEFLRLIKRCLKPAGICMAVLGPDGAGKSTLLANLQPWLSKFHRTCQFFHFRPMILSGRGKGNPVSNPHAREPRSRLSGFLKVILYFLDHWIGWFIFVLPAIVRNGCVVFDRHFEDMLIDPKRYRIDGHRSLIIFLSKMLPPCDLKIALVGSPKLIIQRKNEISFEELARQISALEKLASLNGWVSIDASQESSSAAISAARAVSEKIAGRF